MQLILKLIKIIRKSKIMISFHCANISIKCCFRNEVYFKYINKTVCNVRRPLRFAGDITKLLQAAR